jgi:hypothetical protein
MIEIESIAETITLPEAPGGWFDYGYTALSDGRLALIRLRRDFHVEHMRWSEAVKGGNRSQRYPDVWDSDMRLSIFDGAAESDAAIVPSGVHPIVDRMPDGRWLVAAARAGQGEKNGRIYSPEGRKEHEMMFGDGIENLVCSADGTIWLGYFDEGIFGDANKDGSWPVSSGGIVQFDPEGNVLWSFNQRVPEGHSIADSYAMTLSGTDLWACFYTDFPIARISGDKATFWSNGIAGAKAIAVKDDMVMLAGGYTKDANRIAIVKLDGKTSRQVGSLRFRQGKPGEAGLAQGRGSTLHLVGNGVWAKLPVYQAAEAITSLGRGMVAEEGLEPPTRGL